ncbi:MAG: chorismate-binding protein [Cyclobacteriaceae bacterium]
MKQEAKRSQDILKIEHREDALKLVHSCLKTAYPMAIWRLPNTSGLVIQIDIQIDKSEAFKSVSENQNAFILNNYRDNHPIQPKVIRGDIVIHIDQQQSKIEISPNVSSFDIDQFTEVLKNESELKAKPNSGNEYIDSFESSVNLAIERIKETSLSKVVLSRFKDVPIDESFDALETFLKLVDKYPNAFCYLTNTKEFGLWIGATPEKLIAIKNQTFSTDALAGTQLKTENQDLGDVAWTQKEIEEQAMVSRYIIDCFKKIRLREFQENGPKTVLAGDLLHLKTEFEVDLKLTNYATLGDEMLELLHPTSAVCGYPKDLADQLINEVEGYNRGLYAGFLGPVGFEGATHLFVNLRCMQVFSENVRLYAGAGITADSNAAKEMIETENKMNTMLNVLIK